MASRVCNDPEYKYFLLAWVFVFPSDDPEYLRLETIKMASLKAFGKKILNLAVLKLVKVYQGLNRIAHSTYACLYNACFPVHYAHG